MFCSFTSALPAVCVQCPIWLFVYRSLISCFPGTLLRYCLGDFDMVPVAPIITGITFAVTVHMWWISIMRFLYYYQYLLSVQYLGFKELSLSDDFCVTYTTEFQLGCPDSRVIWTNLPPPPNSPNDRGPAVLSYIKGTSINNLIFFNFIISCYAWPLWLLVAGAKKPSYATAYACNSSIKCYITRKIRPELLRKSFFLPKTQDEQLCGR
jgi:hypothetical protein